MDWSDRQADLFAGPRWEGQIWNPAAAVVVTRVSGHVDASAVGWYTQRVGELLTRWSPPLLVFHDWSQISGFEPDVRAPYRDWATSKAGLVLPRFLVDSKLIAMALSVTAMVLGQDLEVHTARPVFLRALDDAIARARQPS